MENAIAFADAAGFSGCIPIDLADRDRPLLVLDQHPQSTVPSTGTGVELLYFLRREQLAVRIVQLANEAMRGFLEQLVVGERVDIPIRHELEHLLEEQRPFGSRFRLEKESTGDHWKCDQRAQEREPAKSGHRRISSKGVGQS